MTSRVHIALLRGVNVGGKNCVPMKTLVGMFADSGCADVRTYIQSGNVIFRAETALVGRVPGLIRKAIARRFGFEVPVVTRTVEELDGVARHHPFLEDGIDTKTLHVMFLRERPAKARIAVLDQDRSPTDEFALRGREIYLHCPNGIGRSKLTTQYFDSRLQTISTARSWRTVLRLLELAHADDSYHGT